MLMLERFSANVECLFCRHSYMRRAGCGRMWLECLKCRHETEGVLLSVGASAATPNAGVFERLQDYPSRAVGAERRFA